MACIYKSAIFLDHAGFNTSITFKINVEVVYTLIFFEYILSNCKTQNVLKPSL